MTVWARGLDRLDAVARWRGGLPLAAAVLWMDSAWAMLTNSLWFQLHPTAPPPMGVTTFAWFLAMYMPASFATHWMLGSPGSPADSGRSMPRSRS